MNSLRDDQTQREKAREEELAPSLLEIEGHVTDCRYCDYRGEVPTSNAAVWVYCPRCLGKKT